MKFFVLLTFVVSLSCISGKLISDWITTTIDGPAKVAERVELVFTPDVNTAVFLPLKNLPFLINYPGFNASRPTIIYIHGWLESGALDLSVLAIRGAYLDRGDHNVISVDWSFYARNFNYQVTVIPQLKIIAETIAELLRDFLNGGYDIELLHLVGHSLGGQTVGKIGRHLKSISKGKLVIPRIYALDPAGPGFEKNPEVGFEAITRTDGKYVHIIHTCAGQLGMQARIGTIDFYPNGGISHPGCDVDVTSSIISSYEYVCDHARSWHFYQATVRDPFAFPAVRCNSWDDFVNNGTCFHDDIDYMGFGAKFNGTGKYYLQTRGNFFNMSKGMEGTRPSKIHTSTLPTPVDSFSPKFIPKTFDTVLF